MREEPHFHQPRNINYLHKAEIKAGSLNRRVAVGMTEMLSAMPTFWLVLSWIVLWIVANATIAHFDPLPWPLLLCLASVPQLPLMIVLLVSQNEQGRHHELQADEQYHMTQKICHDNAVIISLLQQKTSEVPHD